MNAADKFLLLRNGFVISTWGEHVDVIDEYDDHTLTPLELAKELASLRLKQQQKPVTIMATIL